MIPTDDCHRSIDLDLDALLAPFAATLATAQQAYATASAAFSAEPTNRDRAVDKLIAEEQVKLAAAAMEAERARLVAERRAALEGDLGELNAQLSPETLWRSVSDLWEREAKARVELVEIESERIRRTEAAMALDRRRELIREELGLPLEDRVVQVRAAISNSGINNVNAEVFAAAQRVTGNRYAVAGRNENVSRYLVRYARIEPSA